MNKVKQAKWCSPLEGVGTEEGRLRFCVLQLVSIYSHRINEEYDFAVDYFRDEEPMV